MAELSLVPDARSREIAELQSAVDQRQTVRSELEGRSGELDGQIADMEKQLDADARAGQDKEKMVGFTCSEGWGGGGVSVPLLV